MIPWTYGFNRINFEDIEIKILHFTANIWHTQRKAEAG